MEDKHKDLISFQRLKELLQERGIKLKDFAAQAGIANMSILMCGASLPLTDKIAKMAGLLKVPVSEICLFRKIDIKPYFEREPFYKPSRDAGTELTYRPLRRFLEKYLEEHPEKTADDLYDKVESEKRATGAYDTSGKGIKAALAARGFSMGTKTEKGGQRDYSKGLSYLTRLKLKRDRPLNIRTIYEICRALGCTPGFVMSYK